MIKKTLLTTSIIATALFTGCATQNQPTPVSTVSQTKPCNPLMQGPTWIRQGGVIEGGLGVAGASSKAKSTSFKMDIAQADAYTKAGQQLKTEIIGTLETLRSSHNDLEKETMEKVFALDVKNIPLSGLKVKDMWASECSNDFFVWMVMSIDSKIANAKKSLEKAKVESKIINDAVEVMNDKVKEVRSR